MNKDNEEFWADIDKFRSECARDSKIYRDAQRAREAEELRPLQMLGLVILWVMSVCIAGLLIWFAIFAIDARASAPATVKVIGIPASKRADCHQRRLFAESVAQARINGYSLDMAQADAFLRAMNKGQSINDSCHVVQGVYYVWGLDGNVAGIGNAVYEQCLKEVM